MFDAAPLVNGAANLAEHKREGANHARQSYRFTGATSAQELSVLLVDARSGDAIPNEQVAVQFTGRVGQFETFTAETDGEGIAKFTVPTPIPKNVAVWPELLYGCCPQPSLDTQQAIEYGVVPQCSETTHDRRCQLSKKASQITTRSSEIVVFARPFTSWEKFLRRIWE